MAQDLSIASTTLLAAEPYGTAVFLLAVGVLIGFSVMFSRAADLLGVPIVLLFLLLGMLGGSEGLGGIQFNDYEIAVRLGTMALVLILFDGGLNTPPQSIREVLYPVSLLATVGVAATAGLVALFGKLLGLSWTEALLLGAVVSSTDAAAVFAVLRGGGLHLRMKLGRTIEVESCINDPMAVILTTTMIALLTADAPPGWRVLVDIPVQLVVGAGVGIIMGYLGVLLLQRARLGTVGLYPALTLGLAFASFGVATLAHGSGFLSVYATAVVIGYKTVPYGSGLRRIHNALGWMSQIGMFLMLGLLVFPSRLLPVAMVGLAVGLFLAFVARPLAVVPLLLPFGYTLKDAAFISWVGLRGAVPIILATFPVLAGVPGATRVFDLVFFIVVVSTLIPGSTLRAVTRRLGMDAPQRPAPPAVLEIHASAPLGGELLSFYIEPTVAACGAKLSDIEFPPGSAVVLLVRDDDLIAARGDTMLEAGDHVYVFFRPEDRGYIELLFGQPEE